MKRRIMSLITLIILLVCMTAGAGSAPDQTARTTKITARCVSETEGQELMRGRTLFHSQINERALPFYLQRKSGTVEDYIEYSARQVMPFTPEEERRVQDAMDWLSQLLESHGLKLPDPGTVNFVKTTGKEVQGASGYTSEGTIFLTWDIYSAENTDEAQFRRIVLHELSHCLSRLFPEYRREMYSLIHFTVLDHDIEIPDEVARQILANPDVEHHNSCAAFTINGVKTDCYLIAVTDSVFEKEGDTSTRKIGIVPMDSTTIYSPDDVPDFWDVMSRNTWYVIDPEEAMAENFAFALIHLDDGYAEYDRPEIMEGVIDYLKK